MWRIVYAVSWCSIWGAVMLSPLLTVPRFRGFFGTLIQILTYVWGFTLWVTCCGYVLSNDGVFLVVFGCVLGGIGVVPIAVITAFVHHDAHEGWFLIGCVTLLFVIRALAITAITDAAKREDERKREEQFEAILEAGLAGVDCGDE